MNMSIACIVLGMLIAFLYGISCFFFFIFRFDEEFGGFFLKRNRKEFFLFFLNFQSKFQKTAKRVRSSADRNSQLIFSFLANGFQSIHRIHPLFIQIQFTLTLSSKEAEKFYLIFFSSGIGSILPP